MDIFNDICLTLGNTTKLYQGSIGRLRGSVLSSQIRAEVIPSNRIIDRAYRAHIRLRASTCYGISEGKRSMDMLDFRSRMLTYSLEGPCSLWTVNCIIHYDWNDSGNSGHQIVLSANSSWNGLQLENRGQLALKVKDSSVLCWACLRGRVIKAFPLETRPVVCTSH